jgi:hypothetical protein
LNASCAISPAFGVLFFERQLHNEIRLRVLHTSNDRFAEGFGGLGPVSMRRLFHPDIRHLAVTIQFPMSRLRAAPANDENGGALVARGDDVGFAMVPPAPDSV